MQTPLLDETLVVGPLRCNCRLLACPRTGEALLVDPGDEPARILARIQGMKTALGVPLRVKYLFHTHAHFDHVGATRKVVEALRPPGMDSIHAPRITLHRADDAIYRALPLQGQMFGFRMEEPLPVDHFVEHDERLEVGDLRFTVIHTPGHSPGGVCLRLHEDSATGARETVFSGDTLFDHSVGRTDLWEGDSAQLLHSIRTRLLTLDGDTRVCPGHGPDTRVGIEKLENPFLN